VEKVLGEGIVGHELGDEQPLVPIAAVADQVGKAAVAQLPDPLGLLLRAKEEAKLSSRRIPSQIGARARGGWGDSRTPRPRPSCYRA